MPIKQFMLTCLINFSEELPSASAFFSDFLGFINLGSVLVANILKKKEYLLCLHQSIESTIIEDKRAILLQQYF